MPRRENRGRRGPQRRSRYTMLVYCGGLRTEPDYFEGLRATLRNTGAAVRVHGAGAAPEARRAGIGLAVSNPCFELWLLLHLDDCGPLNSCADARTRLRRHVPTYDKTRLRFGDYASGLPAAVSRARRLDPTGEDHDRNPSTGVWRLVERIMSPPEE